MSHIFEKQLLFLTPFLFVSPAAAKFKDEEDRKGINVGKREDPQYW